MNFIIPRVGTGAQGIHCQPDSVMPLAQSLVSTYSPYTHT
jgi:hypothetical protein